MQEGTIVLKRDVRGRVQVPAEQRSALLAEFKRSGLSGAQFARVTGVKYQTLMNWVAKQRSSSAARPCKGGAPVFVEAVVKHEPSAGVVVDLGHGMTLRLEAGSQVNIAAELIGALRSPC